MQMSPLCCLPLPGCPLFWSQVYYGLSLGRISIHTHTHTYMHTPGVIAFQPQGLDFCHCSLTNHPMTHTKKKCHSLSMSGARSQAFPPISALLPVTTSKLLLLYSHWIYKRGGREDEGKDGGKKVKDGKRDGDG